MSDQPNYVHELCARRDLQKWIELFYNDKVLV